jgi:hypothetical protein
VEADFVGGIYKRRLATEDTEKRQKKEETATLGVNYG